MHGSYHHQPLFTQHWCGILSAWKYFEKRPISSDKNLEADFNGRGYGGIDNAFGLDWTGLETRKSLARLNLSSALNTK